MKNSTEVVEAEKMRLDAKSKQDKLNVQLIGQQRQLRVVQTKLNKLEANKMVSLSFLL